MKLGGSLLTQVDIGTALRRWLLSQPPAQNLVVAGGGDLVEAVRRLDACFSLQPEIVHWMCIDLLRVTYDFLSATMSDWQRIDTEAELQSIDADDLTTYLVAVDSYYNQHLISQSHSLARSLPCDWKTTSDSLACLLAAVTDAEECVLLKSCDVPLASLDELARRGIVDEYLPTLSQECQLIRIERFQPDTY